MQVELLYDDEFIAHSLPFYIPIMAKVTEGSGNYTYEWSFTELHLDSDVSYEYYSHGNIMCLGWNQSGGVQVNCKVTDTSSNETMTKSVMVNAKYNTVTNSYIFNEYPQPVDSSSTYDDSITTSYAAEWKDKYESGNTYSVNYNYYIGKFTFRDPVKVDVDMGDTQLHDDVKFWDSTFDYSTIVTDVKDLLERKIQCDQMWDRFYASDCNCLYSISDPSTTYYPNKFTLYNLLTKDDGIEFHIRVLNDYPVHLAEERLYQAIKFVCAAKGINLLRNDYCEYHSSRPMVHYDIILDDMKKYLEQKYDRMKSVLDIDALYELCQTETENYETIADFSEVEIEYFEPEFTRSSSLDN